MPKDKSKFPQGKYMATVRVGEKGQIVIPKGARDLFCIEPGDTLLLMADIKQGIALVQQEVFATLAEHILNAAPADEEEE